MLNDVTTEGDQDYVLVLQSTGHYLRSGRGLSHLTKLEDNLEMVLVEQRQKTIDDFFDVGQEGEEFIEDREDENWRMIHNWKNDNGKVESSTK